MALNRLAEFLAADAAREWVYGEHDCGLRLGDWYSFATGAPDPVVEFRGAYSRDNPPDLLASIRAVTRRLKLERTKEPQPGDIGVVEIEGLEQRLVIAAIRGAWGWIVPGECGLTCLRGESVRTIAAWRIPQCRQSQEPLP